MAWRPMRSLAEAPASQTTGLRGQVNAIAPNRSKASDGLVGDQNHESTSGHFPHFVAGVGDEIVTAWDCTNDPKNGCDSRKLAETLRIHRDPRIRYVISNREIFSSYDSGSRKAWQWGPYSGVDPHTNHAHIQVLDAKISDTTTPWNLEGFDVPLSDDDVRKIWTFFLGASGPRTDQALQGSYQGVNTLKDDTRGLTTDVEQVNTKVDALAAQQTDMEAKLDLILAKLSQGGGGTFPPSSTFTSSGTVIWTPQE